VVALYLIGTGALEVIGAKVVVGHVICEHLPSNGQDSVRDRDECSFLAPVDRNTDAR
jgi:hypothetical protein